MRQWCQCLAEPVHPSENSPYRTVAGGVAALASRRRQVRQQAQVPEHQRHQEVRGDGHHVPRQRALELRPHVHGARVGHQPVEEPRPPQVQQREEPRLHHREERHRLGEAVHRRPPLLLEEHQDGGDERARVAKANPPHEVDDAERPRHRDVVAPRPDSPHQRHRDGQREEPRASQRQEEQRTSHTRPGPRSMGLSSEPVRLSALCAPSMSGRGSSAIPVGVARSQPCSSSGLRVLDARQVRRARARPQLVQHRVVPRVPVPPGHLRVLRVQRAEDDGFRGAHLLRTPTGAPPCRWAAAPCATRCGPARCVARSTCTSPSPPASAP